MIWQAYREFVGAVAEVLANRDNHMRQRKPI